MKFTSTFKRNLSITASLGSLTTAAANVRRLRLFRLQLGAENTPVDSMIDFQLWRCTTAGTAGSNPTKDPMDPADTLAATAVVIQALTVEPTPGNIADDIPLYQKATYLWETYVGSGSELVSPVAVTSGWYVKTPTILAAGTTPLITASMRWDE